MTPWSRSYPGCTGLKTGYTSSALYCLSASAEREGTEYIAVVLRGESIESRNQDAKTLLNYGFAAYRLCPLVPEEELPALPVEMGRCDSVPLRLEGERAALVPKNGLSPSYELTLPEKTAAPVREGERLGTLRVTLGGETIAELPVCAAAAAERIGFGGILLSLVRGMAGI